MTTIVLSRSLAKEGFVPNKPIKNKTPWRGVSVSDMLRSIGNSATVQSIIANCREIHYGATYAVAFYKTTDIHAHFFAEIGVPFID